MVKKYEHTDIVGREITVGALVASAGYNRLTMGVVISLTAKMIKIKEFSKFSGKTKLRYPDDSVVIDGPEATIYILTNGGK